MQSQCFKPPDIKSPHILKYIPERQHMTPHPKLTLSLLEGRYALCRLDPFAGVPAWAARGEFWSVTRSGDDVSVVCPEDAPPDGVQCEPGWCTLQLEALSFAQTGILDSVVEPLAHSGISLLVVSAYDTNYILVKEGDCSRAITVLSEAGHTIKQ
jgi:hypothetical protein